MSKLDATLQRALIFWCTDLGYAKSSSHPDWAKDEILFFGTRKAET